MEGALIVIGLVVFALIFVKIIIKGIRDFFKFCVNYKWHKIFGI